MNIENPKSVGMLGATFATPNLGVSALAAGAIRCLHRRFPDAELFFLDYEPEISRTVVEDGRLLTVPMVQMRFSKRFWLPNNIVVLLLFAIAYRLLPFRNFRARLKKNDTFRAICDADLFTAVSGGDSFSDLYGMPRFLYVSLPQVLVLLLDKPLVQLPQTYGPFRGTLARRIAQSIVLRSRRAFCRDHSSLQSMFEGHAKARLHDEFCYDMAFGIDSYAPTELAIDGLDINSTDSHPVAGVNVSGLLYREAERNRNSFSIRSDYRETIFGVIDFLIREQGAKVLLVPHVVGDESDPESDLEVCKEIYSQLKGRYNGMLGVARGGYGPNEIRYIIGRLDFFTGSRMHACIAAWSQCIPAVAIAYSDKFLAVLNTIGVGTLAADARKLEKDAIVDVLRTSFHNRTAAAEQLRRVIPGVRSAVHHMLFENPESTAISENSVEILAAHSS